MKNHLEQGFGDGELTALFQGVMRNGNFRENYDFTRKTRVS